MAKINWTIESRNWLQTIHDYIAKDNPSAAQKTIEGIITYDDKVKPVYYKYEKKWKWSLDKSNWRSDVPERGEVVSINNWDVISALKDFSFADGEMLLTSNCMCLGGPVLIFQ